MKKKVAFLAAALVLGGAASCAVRRRRRPPRVVRVEGVDACFNYSLCPMAWHAVRVEQRPASMLVRDGDILLVGREEEDADGMTFPYLEGDGTSLSLRLEDSRLLLAGETVSLKLSEEEAGWRWLGNATQEELARLRLLELDEDVEPPRLALLKKLAEVNPEIGLMLKDSDALRLVLPLFHPRLLILLDLLSLGKEDLAIVSSRQNLEVLWIDPGEIESLDFLAGFPGLRRLLMIQWDPETTGPFPVGCTSLESLALSEAKMKDLSPIAHLTGLSELHLPGCESLTDISGLPGLSALEVLSFGVPEKVPDLSILKELRHITWLGLFGEITQEQLAAVTGDCPGLRTLQLLECEKINDLGPLKALPGLESLVLLGPEASPAPLHEMKGLRLLVLPEDAFTGLGDAEEIRKLEEALPECTVAAGEVCLGSGWILALIPATALAWLFSRRRRVDSPGPRPRDA